MKELTTKNEETLKKVFVTASNTGITGVDPYINKVDHFYFSGKGNLSELIESNKLTEPAITSLIESRTLDLSNTIQNTLSKILKDTLESLYNNEISIYIRRYNIFPKELFSIDYYKDIAGYILIEDRDIVNENMKNISLALANAVLSILSTNMSYNDYDMEECISLEEFNIMKFKLFDMYTLYVANLIETHLKVCTQYIFSLMVGGK